MDDADRADMLQEPLIRAKVAEASARPALPANGLCHNCGEEVEGVAFCSTDCRDDWQKRRHALTIAGKRLG